VVKLLTNNKCSYQYFPNSDASDVGVP